MPWTAEHKSASSMFFDAQIKPREMARNSSKNNKGMNTQSPAIVRGSDQRTRIIVSSSSAAALSAASLFLAVVSPRGARAFAVQLYLLSYEVGRVSGSGAARITPDDLRDIAACRGCRGMSVEHGCIISNSAVAQRMAHKRAAQLAGDSVRCRRASCCAGFSLYTTRQLMRVHAAAELASGMYHTSGPNAKLGTGPVVEP